jgi:1-deoxy-D-xylulose-5-phosphate synthase
VEFLVETFEQIKDLNGPILVHAITQKGKGYHFTENDPLCAHGVTRYDKVPGDVPAKKGHPSYTAVYGKTVLELARADERIVAITAAMPDNTGLTEFGRVLPARMFDVGIAEQHGVTFAAGLATRGIIPMVTIYSTFLQRAYDQVIHDVALQNLPVRFVLDRGGLAGEDGPTHHGSFDLSYLRLVPNMVIMAPKDENELRHMTRTMVDYDRGPSAMRVPRGEGLGIALDATLEALPIGKAEVLREGRDLVFLAIGAMVQPCMVAAEILSLRGIEAGVVNARFVKPLDTALIDQLVARDALIITVEDNVVAGGFGSGVNEYLIEQGFDASIVRNLGLPDRFIEHGERFDLLADVGLSPDGIAGTVAGLVAERRRSVRSAG